jgi:general secretion pathway protein A
VPRRINLLCDRALLGAYANSRPVADAATVRAAAAEVFSRPPPRPLSVRPAIAALGAGVAAAAAVFMAMNAEHDSAPRAAVQTAAPAASAPRVAVAAAPVPVAAAPAASVALVSAPSPSPPTLLRDSDEAFRELARVWKVDAGPGEACKALAAERVQCFSRNVSLSLIRELGRPGVVTLDAATGAPRYALLTALTADSATLSAAGTEQTVTLAALAARWRGDFATLWREPPGYSGRFEARGPLVDWMAVRLGAVNGTPPPAGAAAMDAHLREQLRAFQLAHGLPPDGQPGPMTFMQLNRASGIDEPRLRTQP